MPKGPKGQKRPADVIGNAVKVVRILTGEEQEDFPADDGKDKAALLATVARKFPHLTSAELSEALQDATAAAERRARARH